MTNHTHRKDLDWGDVYDAAAQDPTLDRDCEEGVDCRVIGCPLTHPLLRDCTMEFGDHDHDEEGCAHILQNMNWDMPPDDRFYEVDEFNQPIYPTDR